MFKSRLLKFQRSPAAPPPPPPPPELADFDPQPPRPPFALARPSFTTRHASGISLGTKIQRHLDAGKPLYIGFDPTDASNNEDVCTKRRGKYKKWLRVLTLGAPLDCAVKFILTVGMTMSLLALLWAMNWLIQNRRLDKDFNLVMVIGQCIWGIFFGASCIFGMELMWGKWRRSPSAALIFTICWILVSFVLLVTSAVWIYFYIFFRTNIIEKCLGMTVKVTVTWDKDSLRRQAPKEQIDSCLSRVGAKVNWTLIWGVAYAIFSYLGMIVVIWGRDYRRRLLEIRDCEEARDICHKSGNDKVGLLLGTAPLGRLSGTQDNVDVRHPTPTTAERSNMESIIRISGPATPYGNQKDKALIPYRSSARSATSSIYSDRSMTLGISVEGQSFADARS